MNSLTWYSIYITLGGIFMIYSFMTDRAGNFGKISAMMKEHPLCMVIVFVMAHLFPLFIVIRLFKVKGANMFGKKPLTPMELRQKEIERQRARLSQNRASGRTTSSFRSSDDSDDFLPAVGLSSFMTDDSSSCREECCETESSDSGSCSDD